MRKGATWAREEFARFLGVIRIWSWIQDVLTNFYHFGPRPYSGWVG